MKNIMQGDAYSISVRLSNRGTVITPASAAAVEMTIGSVTKKYPGEIYFADQWYFPLDQQDSFSLSPGLQLIQVRVKFKSGEIMGTDCGYVNIYASESKEVL